jgi:hypothetical protein
MILTNALTIWLVHAGDLSKRAQRIASVAELHFRLLPLVHLGEHRFLGICIRTNCKRNREMVRR